MQFSIFKKNLHAFIAEANASWIVLSNTGKGELLLQIPAKHVFLVAGSYVFFQLNNINSVTLLDVIWE